MTGWEVIAVILIGLPLYTLAFQAKRIIELLYVIAAKSDYVAAQKAMGRE